MTCSMANRRAAVVAVVALGVSACAPAAGAQPIGAGPSYSVAPARAVHSRTSHTTGGIGDWGYVAIGSGAASVVLIGAGGTQVLNRRRN